MRIEADLKLGFKDVLIRPKRSTLSSRSQVSLERTFKFRHSGRTWTGIPIMAANMDNVGTFAMTTALAAEGLFTAMRKHYPPEEWDTFIGSLPDRDWLEHVAVSTGILESDLAKLGQILLRQPDLSFICMDVANGYSEYFVEQIAKVRQRFPDKIIMAGNVVTGEMVEQLLLSGADIVKVGIGPGSVCTTRVKTGVGYPQLSAIIECADAAHGLSGQIISDGGCTCAGDVAKAFGAGADFVMLGGMLAGHDEGGGEILERDGQPFVQFYGMSSSTAMEKYSGGVAEYRASEGKTVTVPYRGPVVETIKDLLGGLRSACTYVGAAQLKELTKRTTFVRVAEQHNPIFDG
ncbi:GMP reductase [Candidatus Competibacter denitrificans Run_A_D11]|uniref:GMP reductase n=1 Tax=Candidatus Competibacter denitrificans Run_A_D11 TaxID=1400863 RepID=W6M7P9_9GAMM|nr:GMP reductase [Candidatus Competibacter denitrificans]CDI03667.1 GMP reductase [Candidatus Competibacter denitrificans Run_A_D11]HAS86760.1 GMP reductase [Candidatus Competibacteraceae bacterium]HRC68347.1 GMP reductase [Candidatus Competibacter denitrificans]